MPPLSTAIVGTSTMILLTLFLLSVPYAVRAQAAAASTAAPATTEEPPTNEAPTESPTEGTCDSPGTPRTPSPITINTYGGCSGGTTTGGGKPGGGTDGLDDMKDKLEAVNARVTQLEGYVNSVISSGGCGCGCGTGGGAGGTGGGGTTGGALPVFGPSEPRFIDCRDHFLNGSSTDGPYHIWPVGTRRPITIKCEFKRNDGYTVIQERSSAQVKFQRNWAEYKRGFGNSSSGKDFWLGLDNIHALTAQREYSLQVDLEDWQGNMRTAIYGSFQIGPESDRYRLKAFFYDQGQSTSGDALSNYHNFLPFSTFDNDNDYAAQNCAEEHGGGWWFRDCDNAQLNGEWTSENVARNGLDGRPEKGIEWDTWYRMYTLRGAKMSLVTRWPYPSGWN